MRQVPEIAIVGMACRLPGARSTGHLWTMLRDEHCAITKIPSDRWSLERFGHPRLNERGRSYTWAAGVLDDIWGFDAAAFGVSPREAEQMDPQQRLLLELTWEALEDAGIRPSALSGSEVGVFVGASTTDHGNAKAFDVSATDGYFATGNAASILANRISYIYDLNGPSFTLDTACSSSLVAFDTAMQALRAGRIDTAIVGGVSILNTPFQFVNFSQATMLSRTGLCQPFSAKADGYVRAEGAGVVVLRTLDAIDPRIDRVRARVLGSRVNSDGRTNGIALPSVKRQAQLLHQLYGEEGIDPARLAFVEAHGTGTPVGDPIEAHALGEVLGQRRTAPLPIGSIKSNIGHMEAAAGMGGLIKAVMALEHDLLPASINCDELNPNIDFDALNLRVTRAPLALPRAGEPRLAGVSSYGFGGTNSHVVLADPPPAPVRRPGEAPAVLMLSAHSRTALGELAGAYADRLNGDDPADLAAVAAGANHHRDRLEERLVVPVGSPAEMRSTLRAFAGGGADAAPEAVVATAMGRDAPVAFVYSGNGGQWVGMGRAAFRLSADFRHRFAAVDEAFTALAGWSLQEALHAEDLAERLAKTSVAQPLIYAIQAASTFALAQLGLQPSVVFGHSVGEVAAAEAAGVLDLEAAVRVIYFRSLHQELAFGAGGMTVLIGAREAAEAAAAATGATIAAYNSPRAYTLSGSNEAIAGVAGAARGLKARTQKLDILYPFHSDLIGAIEEPLLADLATLAPRPGTATFVSTVTGAVEPGPALDATYWWRNVREPVLFAQAVEEASRLGARVFVEIGPNPILLSHIADTLASGDTEIATFGVLDKKPPATDPFAKAVTMALSRGVGLVTGAVLGSPAPLPPALPTYPWQRKSYRLGDTSEAIGLLTPRGWHPLVGARYATDQLEWHGQIDTALLPDLADHVVDGHVLLPGAAFAEMALSVARDWLGGDTATVADFEIHAPLILAPNASRDVRCRVQPQTGTLEIMSRARLGQPAWQTHATAKILHPAAAGARPSPARPVPPAGAATMTADELYPLTTASGLAYGPAFRLLDRAVRVSGDRIVVDLAAGSGSDRFGLDPMRVDACFHGLALLYRELAVKGRLKPYVPVAAGEINLYRPGVAVAGAIVDVVRSDERTIIVHFTLLDAAGEPVARLYRMRFQAMSAFRAGERTIEAVVQNEVLATEPLAPVEGLGATVADLVAAATRADAPPAAEGDTPGDYVLMEGWATATAFGLVEVLAEDGRIDSEALLAVGRLPQRLAGWLGRVLAALERSGLVLRDGNAWTVPAGADLPDPQDILQALAADHPERSAELLLAARTGAVVDALASGVADLSVPVSATAIENFDYGGVAANGSATLVADLVAGIGTLWPKSRALRVLQIGDGPLTARAVRLCAEHGAELTVVEPDRRRLERARLAFGHQDGVNFEAGFDKLPPATFDLLIAAQSFHRIAADRAAGSALSAALAPGALFVAVEPESSVFRDLVFGLHAAMTDGSGVSHLSSLATEAAWQRALGDMDLPESAVLPTRGTDFGLLCLGAKRAERPARTFKGEALVIGTGAAATDRAGALATMLRFSGLKASALSAEAFAAEPPPEGADTVVMLSGSAGAEAPAEALAAGILALQRFLGVAGGRKLTLWLVRPGATRAADGTAAVEAGLWAFGRTLANEHASLQVKFVDLAPGLPADVAARRLRDVVLSGTAETDIVVDAASTHVLRFDRLPPAEQGGIPPADTVVRLVKGDTGNGLDRLQWHAERRRPPEAGEVEIAVDAAGLNFRDVMWGLSILPEEILEDGYAGATLGLECAGRVVRVGAGVTALRVGDPVLAFAKAALATHVTVAASVVVPMPEGLSAESAATVPVAFLTAYYGLIRCARLAEDEWVLIHGGAGGVGLAAMQIARWRGARIIATAGSSERRDLLIALGAEHVFDSRSSAFVDDIRRVTGAGVDVVLNSLSGEAMERSIAVLKPFGRFVELGKRDYVANTHIGLKPFRRNLSYFGVDLDQLILKDDTTGQALFEDVIGLFAEGALHPLPYRTIAATETVEAFRLMQRSGHIGKIVITPPPVPADAVEALHPFAARPDGVHLVTGGFGGFGLETARWLVDHGARHVMLVGRSGAGEEAKAAIAAMEAAGVTVLAQPLDITDEAAVRDVYARFGRDLPRLAGVVHAAALLDDAIIANITAAKLDTVLAAKVTGAAILDRVTRAAALDYFILYSSATTVIGNPGQGAYVAANGYLEGLARVRRGAGLPGLAVAWGAIGDVGLLTRSSAAATSLLQRSGVVGMPARAALDRLAEVLPQVTAAGSPAVVTVAAVNWATAREHLPILRSPSFATLMHGLQAADAGAKSKIKVKALVEKEGSAAASKVIVETVMEEIARILRLPKDDVSRTKPLMDIGLDSLMAVELGMGLEERFELEAPLSSSAGTMSVTELADYIVGSNGDNATRDQTSEDLALRHLGADIRKDVIDTLPPLGETSDAARSNATVH